MIISHTSILTAYIEVDFVGIVIGTLVYGYHKSEHKKCIQIYIAPVLDEKLKILGRAMDDDEIGTSLSGALIECFIQECEECDHRAQNSSCVVSPWGQRDCRYISLDKGMIMSIRKTIRTAGKWVTHQLHFILSLNVCQGAYVVRDVWVETR